MVTRKYISDYRIEDLPDEKGRMKTVAVYHGDYYAFAETDADVKIPGISAVACVVLWLSGLLVNPAFFHTVYVAVPYAGICIPLYFLCSGCMTAWFQKPPFLRSQSDRITNRIPAGSVSVLILGLIALAGAIIGIIIRKGVGIGMKEVVFMISDAFLCTVACFLLQKRKSFKTVKTEI